METVRYALLFSLAFIAPLQAVLEPECAQKLADCDLKFQDERCLVDTLKIIEQTLEIRHELAQRHLPRKALLLRRQLETFKKLQSDLLATLGITQFAAEREFKFMERYNLDYALKDIEYKLTTQLAVSQNLSKQFLSSLRTQLCTFRNLHQDIINVLEIGDLARDKAYNVQEHDTLQKYLE